MQSVRLNEIYQQFNDDIEFFLIYIREAHPHDGWQTPQNLYEDIVFNEPTNEDERAEVGHACQIGLDLKYPMLIDSVDNDVEEKYLGAPIRLYVIDPEGRLTYVGDRGPRGFDAESWVTAIESQIKAGADA
jgi:hypothetical protein